MLPHLILCFAIENGSYSSDEYWSGMVSSDSHCIDNGVSYRPYVELIVVYLSVLLREFRLFRSYLVAIHG